MKIGRNGGRKYGRAHLRTNAFCSCYRPPHTSGNSDACTSPMLESSVLDIKHENSSNIMTVFESALE